MGLPSTLAGTVGFIVFVIFIVGIAATDIYPDQSKQAIERQTDFASKLNATVNSTTTGSQEGFWNSIAGVANTILNFFGMIISFIGMVLAYELMFIGIAGTIPSEFLVLFALLQIGLVTAILKLIFMSGD